MESNLRVVPGIIALLVALVNGIARADDARVDGPVEARSIRLLIVTPSRFVEALAPYLEHERSRQPTELLSLAQALEEREGVDDAEKLKRALYDQWRSGTTHVLLIGEAELMPVRYMMLDRKTAAAHDTAFYPSDLYYADVAEADGSFESWNALRQGHHAHYFGEVYGESHKEGKIDRDEVDYRPELAVGRWPIRSVEQLERVMAKTIAFESVPPTRTAAIVGVGGWVDMRGRFEKLAEGLERGARAERSGDPERPSEAVREAWAVERAYYADSKKDYGTPPPNVETVLGMFAKSPTLIVHGGHGTDDSWQHCLDWRKHLAELRCDGRAPIVFSAGCSTAHFAPLAPYDRYIDRKGTEHVGTNAGQVFEAFPPAPACYQPERLSRAGLGKALLRETEHGAVAYIGCNTGSQPCGLTLVDGFVEHVAEPTATTVGEAWCAALRTYYDRERLAALTPTESWYPPSVFFQGMKFMLFGDPTLPMP